MTAIEMQGLSDASLVALADGDENTGDLAGRIAVITARCELAARRAQVRVGALGEREEAAFAEQGDTDGLMSFLHASAA
jgi:hypothetical protein